MGYNKYGVNSDITYELLFDNEMRERFFQDAKAGKYFKQTKKYALDTQDLNVYTYWSKYMNSSYLEQSKRLK